MLDIAPDELRGALDQWFGFDSFRPGQEEVIGAVLGGEDTLALMPTGAGKSLCYQLPAMLLPGATLVISPLIALMKDQYDNLPPQVYEQSTFINSSLDASEVERRLQGVIAGKTKLIYAAPERLRQQPFLHALRKAGLGLLVVDEVHCLSLWGHDFRPDYLFIGPSLKALGDPQLLGMTATATPELAAEIGQQLGRAMRLVQTSPFRPNLFYQVIQLRDQKEKTKILVKMAHDERGSGIVYVRSRRLAEELAQSLRRGGVSAAHYHAGLDSTERSRVQEEWMLDKIRVIVATIAFGMGIDKANVRFIIHYSPPDSLESYAQESGRAGRDGRPAKCILLATAGDRANLSRWLHDEQIDIEELRAIYAAVKKQTPNTNMPTLISMSQLALDAKGESVSANDDTELKVGIGMMERVGLLNRHADAPASAQVGMAAWIDIVGDPTFANFLQAAGLNNGQNASIGLGTVGETLGIGPDALEAQLLNWRDDGLITVRSGQRQPVVERLPAPRDTPQRMSNMLERYTQEQMRRVEDLVKYTTSADCHHQTLARHLGHEIPACGDKCDNCLKGRSASVEKRVESSKAEVAPLLAELEKSAAVLSAKGIKGAHAALILDCVASMPYPIAKSNISKVMLGTPDSPFQQDQVSNFGALRDTWPSDVTREVNGLLELGFLRSVPEGGKNVVVLGRLRDVTSQEEARNDTHTANRPNLNEELLVANGIERAIAEIILDCIASLPSQLSRTDIARILVGFDSAPIKEDKVRGFGKLAGMSRSDVGQKIKLLIDLGVLQTDDPEGSKVKIPVHRKIEAEQDKELPKLPANPAAVIMDCIKSLPFSMGKSSISKILTGSHSSPIEADRCQNFGALAMCSQQAVTDAITTLFDAGYLRHQLYKDLPVLAVSEQGKSEAPPPELVRLKYKAGYDPELIARKAEREQQRLSELAAIERLAQRNGAVSSDEANDRYERLRAWRNAIALRDGVPPYILFQNATLQAVAASNAQTMADLQAIPGFGPEKIAKYGQQIIEMLASSEAET